MLDEEKKNATFVNQLITKVVDNLQVSINNIHVRFEDKLSNPEVNDGRCSGIQREVFRDRV